MKRFRVAENSMFPTLLPGDEFVGTSSFRPSIGDVVAFPYPSREDFWLVKRVVEHHGVGEGLIWVESDNRATDSVDSRVFGPIERATVMTRVTRLDETTFLEGVTILTEEDQALAGAVMEHGLPVFWTRPTGLGTLTLLILEQQVSLESGAAVFARLLQLCGVITPDSLLAAGEEAMRQIGITRQKASYLTGLARLISTGGLDLDTLPGLTEIEARERLLAVRGIGPWTADAYLLSALRFPDTLPLGDRALQVGVMEVLGLGAPALPEQLEILSEKWQPIRAVAARLIWHAYLSVRGRVEPPPAHTADSEA